MAESPESTLPASTEPSSADPPSSPHHPKSFWLWVMCLTGVDYFSTMGYQPSIAFENTGRLAPLATILLVLITLLGAFPVYAYVARRSPHGLGSIAMLERLLSGWTGKTLVLVLLGFAATDFVITKTLSAADAAEHLISNPLWPLRPPEVSESAADAETVRLAEAARQKAFDRQRMVATLLMLVVLGGTFLRGFKEVIGLAVVIVAVFLTLNVIVIGTGLVHLAEHPDKLANWLEQVRNGDWYVHDPPIHGTSPLVMVVVVLLLFPKLALGLSGFETGVAVMPLIKGDPSDTPENPQGRIRNARKLLLTAALIMSVMLLSSSLVIVTLIEPSDLNNSPAEYAAARAAGQSLPERKPPAKDRALAYLAHDEGAVKIGAPFGPTLGTIYDLSTIVILWFAGASAMAGLLNLVPQYLPRYGMAPDWAKAVRPLVILFTLINLAVTWIFDASVSAQGGAYATGVLVLMSSACVAAVIEKWRSHPVDGPWYRRLPWGFALISAVFVYTTILVVIEKPEGIKIASVFIVTIVVSSVISRAARAKELRFAGFTYADQQSQFLWESIKALEYSALVPHRPGRRKLADKEATIRREHRLPPEVPILFLEVSLKDASQFNQSPCLQVKTEDGRTVLRITQAASIAHTIAAVALELSKVGAPPEIHFGWTDETPVAGTLGFLLFGEGNVPWMVHELIRRAEPDPAKQPPIFIGGR